MKVKTYGVPGLSEWYGKVKAGNIEVEVQFKGGTASPSGAQPAYFVTKDPITQFVIENSKQFKQGFIILVMQHELPGEHPRIARKAREAARAEEARAAAPKSFDKNPKDEDESPKLPAGDPVGEQGEPGEPEAEPATEEKGEVPEAITVSSLDDAKAYLVEHHGCKASELRSKAKIVAAAAEHGIEFIGI